MHRNQLGPDDLAVLKKEAEHLHEQQALLIGDSKKITEERKLADYKDNIRTSGIDEI